MKKVLFSFMLIIASSQLFAQLTYTMGYEKATIDVIDKDFFSLYELPGQADKCGFYDRASSTFYTCDKQTYRYVETDFVKPTNESCCSVIDFDPSVYYGTLTMKGVIENVEWDSMVVYFTADKARLRIQVDEREIDALYENFYKENHLGKVNMILRLKTFDTPKEDQLSYNKITEKKPKPKRTLIKILRW